MWTLDLARSDGPPRWTDAFPAVGGTIAHCQWRTPVPSRHRPSLHCVPGAIEPTEVERQADGPGVFLFAHEVCYKLWHDESVALRAAEDLKVQRLLVELEGEEP
jgi:hypothetical protein